MWVNYYNACTHQALEVMRFRHSEEYGVVLSLSPSFANDDILSNVICCLCEYQEK